MRLSTPTVVEMQAGTDVDLTVEVHDAGGNVINVQGNLVGEGRGFPEVPRSIYSLIWACHVLTSVSGSLH